MDDVVNGMIWLRVWSNDPLSLCSRCWHLKELISDWLSDSLPEAKPLTDGYFLLPLSSEGIQHQADIALIGACLGLEFLQHTVDRFEGIRDLVVQMLL